MFAGALRHSALGEVLHSPRFLALMGVMLIAAVGYGAPYVSRLRYTTELTGDLLIAFADGAFAGACIPPLAMTQPAIVPTNARGAAEIISILRMGWERRWA